MRPLVDKIKPVRGFSEVLHIAILVMLPILLWIVRQLGTQFVAVSLALVFLSKWRMFAVRPRFWAAIIRANGVDLIVGISTIIFLLHSTGWYQVGWTVLYAAWLVFLKPASGTFYVSAQALVAQLAGLSAIFLQWPQAPGIWLVIATAVVCTLSARHFFDSFEEPYSKMLAYLWGYFGAALLWVLSHWLLYYGIVAQPTILLTTIGYGLAALYYFDHSGKLSTVLRRQFVFIMFAIVIVIITFSDWGDKVV